MDKNKTLAAPSKALKPKRPSTVVSTVPRKTLPREKTLISIPKNNKNTTIIGTNEPASTVNSTMPDLDHQVAYGKFLRTMLEDCMIEEKIEREETQMDVQITLLADRFQKTMDQLDKTNRRLKEINFVVEQKRLLDLKNKDSLSFYEITDKSNTENLLNDLTATEEVYLDTLQTKNVDLGLNKETGHKQLLDAVNEAIDGLDQIKKHSNLDFNKFNEYSKSKQTLEDLEKNRFDLNRLKSEFESKFPKFSERLLKDVSEKIELVMKSDD